MAATAGDAGRPGLIGRLRRAYGSERFRVGLLVFDIMTVLAFVVLAFAPPADWTMAMDKAIGVLLLVELVARILASEHWLSFSIRPGQLLDMVIVASLLVPESVGSLAFLRILRALRVLRALKVMHELRRQSPWMKRHGELAGTLATLGIFVTVASAVVFEFQHGINPKVQTMGDALYFTVTSLTTTGYGDITLVGWSGRFLSIALMVCGVSLFMKIAQSVMRPGKVECECKSCGLTRHDPDAVHCKHCGALMHIRTTGE